MRAMLNLKDGGYRVADVAIPYKFITTIIGEFEYTFALKDPGPDYYVYDEVKREPLDYGGQNARSSRSVNSR